MRWLSAILFFTLWSLQVHADASEPLRLKTLQEWKGRILHDPVQKNWLLISPRPVWSARTPALASIDNNWRPKNTAFIDRDVRDAIPTRFGLLVAYVEGERLILALGSMVKSMSNATHSGLCVDVRVDASTVVDIVGEIRSGVVILRVNDVVVGIDVRQKTIVQQLIERNVFAVGILSGQARPRLGIAYSIGASAFMSLVDSSLQTIASVPVPISEKARIQQVGPHIFMISALDGANGSVLTLVNPTTFVTGTRTVAVDQSLLYPIALESGVSVAIISTRTGRPELVVFPLESVSDEPPAGMMIPADYGAPMALAGYGDTIVAVFTGGIVTVLSDGSIIQRDARWMPTSSNIDLVKLGSTLIVSSRSVSVAFELVEQPFWFVIRALDWIVKYVIPLLLFIAFSITYALYRRQRRFFNTMIDIPGAGLVFVLDGNGRLVRTNERAASLLRITMSVPMRRLFRSYTQRDGLEQVTKFLGQVQMSRAALSEKVAIEDGDDQREYVFTSVPLTGLFGRQAGSIITGVDITEALERRRLVNWAQLAHDMQTNLSTIRLNAEQLGVSVDPRDSERRRRILFQSGILIHRVRDLVSVGRNEEVSLVNVHSAEFCTELRHEFDPAMFPHVNFSMKLRGTMMQADRLKLQRAVRNAVENAIKALRGKAGTVEIATWFDRTNVFIRISDTGVGMDSETLSNMMRPYFTTAKDGSGTGIGTMIMQHVMNLHDGSLRVSSKPGEGTQVIFRVPHHMDIRVRSVQTLEEVRE